MANNFSMVVVQKARSYFAAGKSVKQISRMNNMPSERTLNKWIEQQHGGEWIVPVRQIRVFVNPQELECLIATYFTSAYKKCGHWSEPLTTFDEKGNEILGERHWIADLDSEGNQLMQLKKPLTWSGLAVFLKVSVSTLNEYRKGTYDTEVCKYSEILEMAEDKIREFNVEALYSKETVNGAKFILGRAKAFKKDFKEGKDEEDTSTERKLEDWFSEEK